MKWKRFGLGLAISIIAAFLAQAVFLYRAVQAEAVVIPLPEVIDGATEVAARVYRTRDAGALRPAIILCHGYAACKETLTAYAVELARAGMVVVAFDFPGHGQSPGICAVEQDHASVIAAVHDWLLTQPGVDRNRIGILGHSFGGFTAADYLQRQPAPSIAAAILMGASYPEEAFRRAARGDAVWQADTLLLLGYGEYILPPETLRDQIGATCGVDARRQVEAEGFQPDHCGTLRLFVSPYSEHCLEAWDGLLLQEATAWFTRKFHLTPASPPRWVRVRYLLLPLAAFTAAWLCWMAVAQTMCQKRDGASADALLALLILAGFIALVRLIFFPFLYSCPWYGRWWLHAAVFAGVWIWQWAREPLLERSWRNPVFASRPGLLFAIKAIVDLTVSSLPLILVVFWLLSCGLSVSIGDIAVRGLAWMALTVASAAIRVIVGKPRVERMVIATAAGWVLPVLGGLR